MYKICTFAIICILLFESCLDGAEKKVVIVNRQSLSELDHNWPDKHKNGFNPHMWNTATNELLKDEGNHTWILIKEPDGSVRFRTSTTKHYLEVEDSLWNQKGLKDGKSQIQLWEDANGKNQRWKIIPLPNSGGAVLIQNVKSGLYLNANLGDPGNGGRLTQWDGGGGENQHWYILPVNSEDRFPLKLSFSHKNMETYIEFSNTGLLSVSRYAGIRKQRGTYHHSFAICLYDEKGNALWYSPVETLTIGAANTTLGKPSFVSKREMAKYDVPKDLAKKTFTIVAFMKQDEKGGTLWEQFKDLDKKWGEIKDSNIAQDIAKAYAAYSN